MTATSLRGCVVAVRTRTFLAVGTGPGGDCVAAGWLVEAELAFHVADPGAVFGLGGRKACGAYVVGGVEVAGLDPGVAAHAQDPGDLHAAVVEQVSEDPQVGVVP